MHQRVLRLLLRLSLDHPRAVAAVILALTAVSLVYVPRLEVKAGHSKMVSADNPTFVRFNQFLERFGSPNALAVLVEGGNEPLRRRMVDALAHDLPSPEGVAYQLGACQGDGPANAPGCVKAVMGHIDLEPMASWGLLYLPVEDVDAAVTQLQDETLGANVLLDTRGLTSIFQTLGEGVEAHAGDAPPEGADLAKAAKGARQVAGVFDVLTERVRDGASDEHLIDAIVGAADVKMGDLEGVDRQGYVSSDDGTLKLAMVSMVSESDDPVDVVPFIEYVESRAAIALAELNRQCTPTACPSGPLFLRATGLPAILADESRGIQRDIVMTSIVAFLGVFLLFAVAFRSKRLVFLAITPIVPALLWTMAIVEPFFDYLNIVTSAFVAIAIGLGVDFAVFILARYQEARRAGEDARQATETAVLRAGPGLITGGMTTALAFLGLGLTEFKAFAEMGIMGGISVTLALLTSLTILPAVLASDRTRWFHAKIAAPARSTFGASIPAFVVRHAVVISALGVGLALSGGLLGRDIPWAFDYMDVLDQDFPSVQAWHELTRRTQHSTQVAALVADSIEEAQRFHAELKTKSTVGRVESVVAYLPDQQHLKLAIVKRLAATLSRSDEPPPDAIDRKAIVSAIQGLEDVLEDQRFEAERAHAPQATLMEAPIASLRTLRKAITDLDESLATTRLTQLQADVLDLRDRVLAALRKTAQGEELTPARFLADLPAALRDRLVHDGQYAVYVYPRAPLEEEPELRLFVSELYSVDAEATGFPINHWELYSQIRRGYHQAGLVTLLMVFFLLLLDFRSLGRVLLSMMPLGLGLCGAWGGMWALDMRYNPATLIAFPLIVGIGVDAAVHILHRHYQDGRADIAAVVRYTGRAVLLSGSTTMVGFGSLSLAGHKGIAHMGLVLLMGVGWSLVGATVILPAFLTLIERRRGTDGANPSPPSSP